MSIIPRMMRHHAPALLAALFLGACSTAPVVPPGEVPAEPQFSADRVMISSEETSKLAVWDPWEGFNRTMFRFNYRFDRYVFLPAVQVYRTVTPDIMEQGIHNFFRNIRDITTLINSILQLSPEKTANTATRLVINSTIGILGFIDVAHDVPRSDEDFGQTLGHWGVGPGPYLVLPILGPSSLRDGTGTLFDRVVYTELRDAALNPNIWETWTMDILDAIDTRANTAFRYYETGSPFEYDWVRLLYSTKRQLDVER